MKNLIIIELIALLTLSSCMDDSVWADDGPSRHDLVRDELEETYASATKDHDLYGVMIILRENDSIALRCRDSHNFTTGITEDIDLVIDDNQIWIYKDVYYPDGSERRFRLEWLYHNTHSTTVEYYRHEPGFEHLNEDLNIRSIAVHTSIWNRIDDIPREFDYHGLWKEIEP